MDWTEIIIPIISALIGGGLGSLFTLKQQKKSLEIDNATKEDERYLKLVDELQDQIEGLNIRMEKKDERITELEDRCLTYRNQLESANSELIKAKFYKCLKLKCLDRKPPFGYTELSPNDLMEQGVEDK